MFVDDCSMDFHCFITITSINRLSSNKSISKDKYLTVVAHFKNWIDILVNDKMTTNVLAATIKLMIVHQILCDKHDANMKVATMWTRTHHYHYHYHCHRTYYSNTIEFVRIQITIPKIYVEVIFLRLFVCLFVYLFASDLMLQNQITFDLAAKIQIQINVSSYLIFHLVLLLSRNHLVVFSARFGWREWVCELGYFFYMFPLVNWYASAYCSCNMVCLFAVYSRALANPIWNGKIRVSIFSGELEYRAKADSSRM